MHCGSTEEGSSPAGVQSSSPEGASDLRVAELQRPLPLPDCNQGRSARVALLVGRSPCPAMLSISIFWTMGREMGTQRRHRGHILPSQADLSWAVLSIS